MGVWGKQHDVGLTNEFLVLEEGRERGGRHLTCYSFPGLRLPAAGELIIRFFFYNLIDYYYYYYLFWLTFLFPGLEQFPWVSRGIPGVFFLLNFSAN